MRISIQSIDNSVQSDKLNGVRKRISVLSGGLVVPAGFPGVTADQAAEAGHAVDAADAPAGAGLFEAAADHVFAGAFDLAAADRAAFGQTLGVVQMRDVVARIVPQTFQRGRGGRRNAGPHSLAGQQNQKQTPVFEEHPLFQAKEAGYHCYRIPALLVTKPGTVLAFAEARKNNCNDHGDVDLVLKRSSDGRRTWSEQQLLADGDAQTIGNPCPVQDRETGTIWLPVSCEAGRNPLNGGAVGTPAEEIPGRSINTWEKERR